MKTFKISQQEEGMRVNRYLAKAAPGLTVGLLHKYLRAKRIKLNGRRCQPTDLLHAGDELTVYLEDVYFEQRNKKPDLFAASDNLQVLYEDANLAVLYKPAGLLSHAGGGDYGDSLLNRFLRHLCASGEYDPTQNAAFAPALCNRLDRDTQGIVVAAKTARSLMGLNDIIRGGRMAKYYRCIVTGTPPADGRYRAYLKKNAKTNTVTVTDAQVSGAKEILTRTALVARNHDLSLLDIDLITGRSHQIRAHLAHLGAPVLGDTKYGSSQINRQYGLSGQALCAYKIVFELDAATDDALYYLNGKSFSLDRIHFVERFFPTLEKS